ncbi:UvrD-helicase domain-containing protein [Streptomyces smyrnaeus]|uniref:UvrD-helicase domain-containing protein n=1 Tax=Streptomyces smyrnaeus TaxID=1387713 RepID=UPI00368BCDEE
MATLGLHKDFLLEFARLERPVQRRVYDVFGKFEHQRHAGMHLEKMRDGRDPRLKTVRIDRFWRGVVLAPDEGDTFLLLKVLPHDKAIDWARTHRATVNSATRGIELRNDVALERATAGLKLASEGTPQRLFTTISDGELRRLGVDADVLPLVRLLTTEEELEALHRRLPEQQYDVLAGLAAGMTPEEVWREVVQAQLAAADHDSTSPVEPAREAPTAGTAQELDDVTGFTGAMARSQGRVALVSGPAELMEILSQPFAAWRVFLHPSQRRVAYRPSYAGPARVTGGPGTGKTVVALHRAYHLARRLPADAPDNTVLLTTFTKDLAVELHRCLRLLTDDDKVLAKIRVVHIDAVANEILRDSLGDTPLRILSGQQDVLSRWEQALTDTGVDFTPTFLDQEWRHVVLAQDLRDAESYLKASRAGRGKPLGPLKRAQAWRAIHEFTTRLRAEERYTFLQVSAEAARVLAARGGERPYRHVVVDEAQDLHPAQWRLLRELATRGRDDLFIAGDPYQRIYGNKASLRSLGITVTGRSARLRINYRTTREILSWATDLLTGDRIDDLDEGDESLSGYRSALRGRLPRLAGHATKADEIAALIDEVRTWTSAGIEPADVGVAVRYLNLGREISAALERSGIPSTVLTGESSPREGVRVGTMHRMKGLEFRCMAVAGVRDGVVPMQKAVTELSVDPQQHQEDLLTELSLLFVACTRAREALYVSWHGSPSPFLPKLS